MLLKKKCNEDRSWPPPQCKKCYTFFFFFEGFPKGDLNKIKVYKLTSTNAGKAGSVQATRVSLGLLSTFNIILLKINCIFYENS